MALPGRALLRLTSLDDDREVTQLAARRSIRHRTIALKVLLCFILQHAIIGSRGIYLYWNTIYQKTYTSKEGCFGKRPGSRIQTMSPGSLSSDETLWFIFLSAVTGRVGAAGTGTSPRRQSGCPLPSRTHGGGSYGYGRARHAGPPAG